MRRRLLLTSVLSLTAAVSASFVATSSALAQDAGTEPSAPPAAEPAADPAEPAAEPEPDPAPTAEPAPAATTGQPPQLAPLELGPAPNLPDPGEAARQLEAAAPPPPPPEKKGWTASETVFHMHGYFRLRGNLLKDGALGHRPEHDRLQNLTVGDTTLVNRNYDPFPYFTPSDRYNIDGTTDAPVVGGCGSNAGDNGRCSKKSQVSGDMRLRLKPEIHLSDDVRVKAWIDVLDNVGLGTMGYGPNDFSAGNAIKVRRVWGEARNRDIGELRFGRMGADWGLGILDNGGDRYGIDSDFSSDVDRVMGMTNLAGFYLMAAYDWAHEGEVLPGSATPSGIAIDRAQNDDTDAFTFAVARRLEPEAQQGALLRGEKVFNFGAYFVYRDQLLKLRDDIDTTTEATRFVRLNQTQYIPDLWLQFLWEGLRLELEATYVAGSLEGGCPMLDVPGGNVGDRVQIADAAEVWGRAERGNGTCKFRQMGAALEIEYRLFDDKLGVHLNSGFASGDKNAYGLAATNDPSLQRASGAGTQDDTISTFQFHPDYRVDLILWRTLMRRVAGAYYIKPGLSYDFIKDPYGQVAGGRFDLVYSRASSQGQTWGKSGNLGLELDVSLYYRSEDGPDVMDGFYGLVQWGILFPFQGLGYTDEFTSAPSTQNAMIFRGVAGISF